MTADAYTRNHQHYEISYEKFCNLYGIGKIISNNTNGVHFMPKQIIKSNSSSQFTYNIVVWCSSFTQLSLESIHRKFVYKMENRTQCNNLMKMIVYIIILNMLLGR